MSKDSSAEFQKQIAMLVKSIQTEHVDLIVSYCLPEGGRETIILYAIDKPNILRVNLSLRRIGVTLGIMDITITSQPTKKPVFIDEEPKKD